MTTQQIADALVANCRQGKFDEAYALYADTASSYEMEGMPNHVVTGLPAILKKSAEWSAETESLNEMRVSDPIVSSGYFAVSMYIDITKKDGTREKADEICLYKVKDGKIVEERFYYDMG